MHILDQIVQHTHGVIAERQQQLSLPQIRVAAEKTTSVASPLRQALARQHPLIIAEFKRKSPSRPNINVTADPVSVARAYEAGGAAAMSVLTEPGFFAGSPDDLRRIRPQVNLPLLRKDFIIDPYQIYEAKALGANLILLIARILEPSQIRDFCQLAHELDMEVLFEIHHLEELDKIRDAAIDFLGVNCRDLSKFQTNLDVLVDAAQQLPKNWPWVAESGIAGPDDVRKLYETGYQLFLVGEYLMREGETAARLESLWR